MQCATLAQAVDLFCAYASGLRRKKAPDLARKSRQRLLEQTSRVVSAMLGIAVKLQLCPPAFGRSSRVPGGHSGLGF